MGSIPQPSRFQSQVVSLLLIALSLLLLPASLAVTSLAWLRAWYRGTLLSRCRSSDQKTILINGARATKALVMARAFKKAGHRVILAEEISWGKFCAARYSSASDSFVLLSDPVHERQAYIDALCGLVLHEHVDLFIPCSTGGATIEDAEAAQHLRKMGNQCISWVPKPEMSKTLHVKDLFHSLCEDLGMDTPQSRLITSIDEAIEFLHPSNTEDQWLNGGVDRSRFDFILKSVAFGDDAGRGDLTLLPKATREATRAHLAHTSVPISPNGPHVLQRFVKGPEVCTHAQVWQGELRSFVCCPSSDLLMRYLDVRRSALDGVKICQLAEDWTRDFLDRWKIQLGENSQYLTGHFSFDFIYERLEQKLYPIECNPRVHTAITLLASLPTPMLAQSYFEQPTALLRPRPREPAHAWLAHSLPRSLGQHYLPSSLCPLIHPLLHPDLPPSQDPRSTQTWSPLPQQGPLRLLWAHLVSQTEFDAEWDADDPVPWFALAHIHWPWLLFRGLQGKGWSRLNVSTSRIFLR